MIITGTRVRGGKYYGGTASAVATDEYFNLVALLLPGNGTNGAQNNTFLDSSTNNFTVTRNGNTTQGTFSPFSQTGWSNYFDGAGDTLQITPSSPLDFGTGDFTVELWALFDDISVDRGFIGSSGTLGYDFVWRTSTGLNIGRINAAFDNTFAWTPTVGVWYHIVYCRSGTSLRVFVNGTQIGSTATNSISYNSATTFIVGGSTTADRLFLGYLSNMRLIKGTALYTSNFTPPTAPLTAISGTSLLTCQSNRFIDNSANAFAITVAGNTSVQAFSPFDPTAAYSTTTVGGSGYFDGTGDYLATPSNAAFTFGTGDLTLECWIYQTVTSSGSYQVIFSDDVYGSTGGYTLYSYNNALNLWRGGGEIIAPAGTITLNAWNHVAWTRSGSSNRLFINGNQVGSTTTDSTNYTGSLINIGASQAATFLFFGYISNARALKGTALYTANFTVPTAPLTAIANTSLLLNYTNGGITDAAAKNVLETVGGAAISTTQSKFGGSSMAFDSGLGSYLLLPSPQTQNFVFGSGDFTIEFFIFFTATAQFMHIYDQRPAATDGAYPTIRLSTGGNQLEYVSGGSVRIAGGSITTNVWYHVALSRSGTSTKLFLNGTQVGSTFTDTTSYLNGTNRPFIGRSGYHTVDPFYLGGYIDDLRITKGYARYTANFTPPTAAFPTQ